jgi:hypothetical protein
MSSRRIGNYQITDYLGSGGFGSVFKAEDVNTPGRVVAIKELHKKHTRNAIIKQRFFQEAVATARLDHPNLPRLYTFGEDNGSYYLVMEFISGKLLSEEIQDSGPVQPARAISILAQVLEALSYAHRNGIIHRDLKPDNIMLADEGSLKIKVLDFGIARIVGGENLTLTGQGFGTPAYMSPERMSGAAGDDPRIDIYSAGIILYEMLTGKTPFQSHASDPVIYWSEMRDLHTGESLPPLASFGVSAELEQIVKRATAKRVEDRSSSADELLTELKSIGGGVDRAESVFDGASRSSLLLTVVPGAADVFVDDVLRGSADAMRGRILVEGLAPGLHSVRVAKAGFSEYRINVSLEEGGQTDLQVALAARVTVAMPVAENTAADGFDTTKVQRGNEADTALIVVESLPVGSTLFIGSSPIAQAGEDGRATVRLNPGTHEVKVTAPTGETAKSMIMVNAEEAGSSKTLTFPLLPPSTTESTPAAIRSDAGSAGKRIAMAAVIALLLALAAASFFVLRGPQRSGAQIDPLSAQVEPAPTSAPVAQSQPGATSSAAQDAASAKQADAQAQADASRVAEDRERAREEAEKAKAEKRLIDEKKLIDKKAAAPDQAAPVVPTPPAATPQPQSQPPSVAQVACVGVMVTGGQSNRYRLMIVEQPENSSAAVTNGQTNARGMWYRCGFTAGHRVRVVAFGMRGALRGTKEVSLTAGRNLIEVQVNEQPNVAPQSPFTPGKRQPRFKRP